VAEESLLQAPSSQLKSFTNWSTFTSHSLLKYTPVPHQTPIYTHILRPTSSPYLLRYLPPTSCDTSPSLPLPHPPYLRPRPAYLEHAPVSRIALRFQAGPLTDQSNTQPLILASSYTPPIQASWLYSTRSPTHPYHILRSSSTSRMTPSTSRHDL
jgi:hypothetical protein